MFQHLKIAIASLEYDILAWQSSPCVVVAVATIKVERREPRKNIMCVSKLSFSM